MIYPARVSNKLRFDACAPALIRGGGEVSLNTDGGPRSAGQLDLRPRDLIAVTQHDAALILSAPMAAGP